MRKLVTAMMQPTKSTFTTKMSYKGVPWTAKMGRTNSLRKKMKKEDNTYWLDTKVNVGRIYQQT